MRLLGYEITFTKATPQPTEPLNQWGGWGRWWWPSVHEPFTGAWQQNMELRTESLLTFHALYRCITLISSDIAKMQLRLVEQDSNGIWSETSSNAFTPVLTKPNRYQTRIQFIEEWLRSKLIHGNTYVFKVRDQRGVVFQLYILDPRRVKVLVAPDGSVFYELHNDSLSGLEDSITVPASEIIHDRYSPLYHTLCGLSPITACALAGSLGLRIQNNSAQFFANRSIPSGILTAPSVISDDAAKRLKQHWEDNYSGENVGRGIAVLGDGLTFEAMRESSTDAQLVEQLKLTAEIVCTAFGVPPYMIGVGDPPSFNNVEALNIQYYSQCLQILIESIELLLDEGLGLTEIVGKTYGTEFDIDDLLRMDSQTRAKTWSELRTAGMASPNEGRAQFNLKPVEGGDTPYLQQQNYSLVALNKRDQGDDPFDTAKPAASEPADDEPVEDGEDGADVRSISAAEIINNSYKHDELEAA